MPFTIGNFIQKNLTTTAGLLRSAAVLTVAGVIAGGAILGYGVSRPNPSSNTSLTDKQISTNFLAKELTSGCVNAGTATGCVMVIAGVTQNGFIFTHTGGILIGSFANPTLTMSGGLMRIGGGWPGRPYFSLETVQGISGATLHAESNLTSSGGLKIVGNTTLGGTLTATSGISTLSGTTAFTLTATKALSGGTIFSNSCATNQVYCKKSTGQFGCQTVSATGTLVAGGCQ